MTIAQPPTAATDIEAIAYEMTVSESDTLYLRIVLDDDTRLSLLFDHGLHAELDAVRGGDAVRRATEDEVATAASDPLPRAQPVDEYHVHHDLFVD